MTIVYISKQGEEFQTSGPNVLNLGSVQRIQFLDRPSTSNQIIREIYVAVAHDQGFEAVPRYNGVAARIQVEEMAEDKLKKSFYIRKGTGAFSPPAIYDGLCRRFAIETQPNGSAKLIYVSQDGNTFPPNAIYKIDGDVLTEFVPMPPTPPQVIVFDDQYYIAGQQPPLYLPPQQPPTPIQPTLQPDAKGELTINQITAYQNQAGSDPSYSTDGNPDTYWEGTGYLQADLGGYGGVKSLKLKFRGQVTFTIHTSLDATTWYRVPLGTITNQVSIPGDEEFEYFTFPSVIPSRYIRIVPEPFGSKASVITFKVMPGDPVNKIPTGFMAQQQGSTIYAVTGQTNDKFKWWGRHRTNYRSGGSGPSERWNCDAQYLNCEATLKFNIGDPRKKDDNISIKFRAGSHDDENGGWLIAGVKFNGEAVFGKENPHPTTKHYEANEKQGAKIPGGIANKDVFFKGIVYNENNSNAPIAEAWYRLSENESWTFMGSFRDTGQDPGGKCDRIGIKGSNKQQIQVRVDEAPDAKLISATVAELSTPIRAGEPGKTPSTTLLSTGTSTQAQQILWTSDIWNRNKRTVGPDETDKEDSRVKLLKVGDPLPKATIDGQGECTLRGGSPRLYINGQYQNVEFSTELSVEEDTEQCYLSARTNHEDRNPDGFGGYPLYLDIKDKMMFFKKEQAHNIGYSERKAEVPIPDFVPKKWFKARVRITNTPDNKVKMEGWFNEKDYTSYIDDGQISCGKNGVNRTDPPFTGIGKSCFFRVNGNKDKANVKVKYRNASISSVVI